MKKLFSLLLALMLFCTTFAAMAEPVTLEFFYQRNDTIPIEALVKAFNESQDEVEVKMNLVSTDTGKQIFQTRLATDEPMDLLQHWATQIEFSLQGAEGRIVDLSNESWAENILPYYKELSSVDGKLYSLPLAVNTSGIIYNVDMFNENGWAVPTTWDELIQLCETIKAAGYAPMTWSNKDKDSISQKFYFLSIAESAVGDIKADEFYLGIVNGNGETVWDNEFTATVAKKLVQLSEYAQPDSLGCSYDQANADFAAGKTPMLFNGTWVQPSLNEYNPELNYAYFPIPSDTGEIIVPTSIDCSLAAMTGTGNEAAALKFLEFAANNAQLYIDLDGQPSGVAGVECENERIAALTQYINSGKTILMYGDWFPAGSRNDIDNACQNLIMDKDIEAFAEEWQRIMVQG